MPTEDELNATTFQIYLYLVKIGQPAGPRDIMRGANISSPGVVHRNLQKLMDLGVVDKDAYGRYAIKEKITFKGYVWFGRNLIPRFILFSSFFLGLLIVEIAVLAIRMIAREPIESSYLLLTIVTALSAAMFLLEGFQLRKKMKD